MYEKRERGLVENVGQCPDLRSLSERKASLRNLVKIAPIILTKMAAVEFLVKYWGFFPRYPGSKFPVRAKRGSDIPSSLAGGSWETVRD